MRVLHVVNRKGGGIGRYLSILEGMGEEVWEVGTMGVPAGDYDTLVVHGVVPEVAYLPGKKVYYFHGLRAVSPKILRGRREFNPMNLIKFHRFKRFLSRFDLVLFPTEAIRGKAKEIYGVDGEVLYLPFPDRIPESTVVPEGKTLLWVGREAWIKGYDTLLTLVRSLPGWEFVVVGMHREGPSNLKALGRIGRERLNALYREATFTLITSYYESFSYVALESMAAGTPVLVLERAGGAAEIVKKVGLGRVFKDTEALASYLRSYRGERFTSGDVGDTFSPHAHLKRLKEILRKLPGET